MIKEMRQYFLQKYPDEAKANPQFELYQLLIIAKNKTILGENASAEFKRIYEIRRTPKDLLKYVLCVTRLLPLYYKLKKEELNKLP